MEPHEDVINYDTAGEYPLRKNEIRPLIAPNPKHNGPRDKEVQVEVWEVVELALDTFAKAGGSRGIPAATFGKLLSVFTEAYDVKLLREHNHLDIIEEPTEEEATEALEIFRVLVHQPPEDLANLGLLGVNKIAATMGRYLAKWRAWEKLNRVFLEEYTILDSLKESDSYKGLFNGDDQPPKFSLSQIEEVHEKLNLLQAHSVSGSVIANLGARVDLDSAIKLMFPKEHSNDSTSVRILKNNQRQTAERVKALFKQLNAERTSKGLEPYQPGETFLLMSTFLESEDIKRLRGKTKTLFDPPTDLDRQKAIAAYDTLRTLSVVKLYKLGGIYLNHLRASMDVYAEKWRTERKFTIVYGPGLTLRQTLEAALANPDLMRGAQIPPEFVKEEVDEIRLKLEVISRNSLWSNMIESTQRSGNIGYKRT